MPRRWQIAALLAVGVLVNYVDRVNLSVSEPALVREFGIDRVTFGYLLAAYSWTYAALQMPMGVLLDRIGVTQIGRVSTLVWSVASFWAALAGSVGALFSARLLLGVGEAPTFPASAKAIGSWFPVTERSFATALFDAAAKLGPALGAPLIGALIIAVGWRLSFAATALLSFLYFIAFWALYRNPVEVADFSGTEREHMGVGKVQLEGSSGTRAGAPLGYLLRQRKVLGLALGFASYNYTFYLLLAWLPSYLESSLHIDLLRSALYTSIPFLVATLTDLIIGGWCVDALVRRGWNASRVRQSILVTGTLLGLGILGAANTHSLQTALFWISLSFGGLAAAAPVGWSIPSLIAPHDSAGRIGGIMNFFSQCSAIAAPIITGYVASTGSFYRAFAIAAAFILVGVVSYLVLLGRIEPVAEPERVPRS